MTDDRYVHDPDALGEDDSEDDAVDEDDAEGAEGGTSVEDDASAESASASSSRPDPDQQTFGRRNWLLVAALVVAFLVVPGFIIYQPVRVNSFVFTYLVLPLVPAFLLGAMAVWATTR